MAWLSVQSWYCNHTESDPYCYSRKDKFSAPDLHLLDYQGQPSGYPDQLLIAWKGVISKIKMNLLPLLCTKGEIESAID